MGRAPCCEKVGLKRGRWTKEEDEVLARYIQEHGEGSWRTLPKNAGLLRCGKSCRLRWINYLRADLKRGNISGEEEEVIMKLHATLGNRWSLIAGHLPGRTDNEIKNYWNSHLSRRASSDLGRGGAVVNVDLGKLPGGGKRRGGRTNRDAKGGGKETTKVKNAKGSKEAAPLHHHQHQEEEERGADAPTPCSGSSARSEQASASGVTSDGLEDGPLGLSDEMVSGLVGHASPKLELDRDVDSVGAGPCAQTGSGPAAVQEEVMGDKALQLEQQDWDLAGLDIPVDDDMWDYDLVWNYDDVVVGPEAGQQGLELFFMDDNTNNL